jgi:hypothetical protein
MTARTGNCYRWETNQVVSFTSTSMATSTAFQTGVNTVGINFLSHRCRRFTNSHHEQPQASG